MLKILKNIKGTLLTEYGAFDTGIEFKKLTSRGATGMWHQWDWPVEGPYSYSDEEKNLAKKMLEIGCDNWSEPPDEEWLRETVNGLGLEPWPDAWIEKIVNMDDEKYSQIKILSSHDCEANREYFFYDNVNEMTVWNTEKEAVRAYLDDCTGGYEKPWGDMDDDELDEYINELDYIKIRLD